MKTPHERQLLVCEGQVWEYYISHPSSIWPSEDKMHLPFKSAAIYVHMAHAMMYKAELNFGEWDVDFELRPAVSF